MHQIRFWLIPGAISLGLSKAGPTLSGPADLLLFKFTISVANSTSVTGLQNILLGMEYSQMLLSCLAGQAATTKTSAEAWSGTCVLWNVGADRS